MQQGKTRQSSVYLNGFVPRVAPIWPNHASDETTEFSLRNSSADGGSASRHYLHFVRYLYSRSRAGSPTVLNATHDVMCFGYVIFICFCLFHT